MLFFTSTVFVLSSLVSIHAFTGDITFYDPEADIGACGTCNTQNEYVAAVANFTFDTFPGATPNPNENPICGRNLRATYQDRSVVVKLVDRCAGCPGASDVDMSPIAFRVLAPENVGRLHDVEWDWTDNAPGPVRKREEGIRPYLSWLLTTYRMDPVRKSPQWA